MLTEVFHTEDKDLETEKLDIATGGEDTEDLPEFEPEKDAAERQKKEPPKDTEKKR